MPPHLQLRRRRPRRIKSQNSNRLRQETTPNIHHQIQFPSPLSENPDIRMMLKVVMMMIMMIVFEHYSNLATRMRVARCVGAPILH
jgi:hypothetical protein